MIQLPGATQKLVSSNKTRATVFLHCSMYVYFFQLKLRAKFIPEKRRRWKKNRNGSHAIVCLARLSDNSWMFSLIEILKHDHRYNSKVNLLRDRCLRDVVRSTERLLCKCDSDNITFNSLFWLTEITSTWMILLSDLLELKVVLHIT